VAWLRAGRSSDLSEAEGASCRRRRNSHQSGQQQLPHLTRRSLAKFICRPAPMKISTRRAGASSSDTSLRSEIDVCRHLVLNLDQSAKVFRVVELLDPKQCGQINPIIINSRFLRFWSIAPDRVFRLEQPGNRSPRIALGDGVAKDAPTTRMRWASGAVPQAPRND
jgi:hypothetical protein